MTDPHNERPNQLRLRLERLGADAGFAALLLVLVVLAGWLSARHDLVADLTQQHRNSLGPESLAVLGQLEAPLHITVYADPSQRVARDIARVLDRYRRAAPKRIKVTNIDPLRFPERARDENIELLGQLVLEYRGRRESLTVLSEHSLTNAISRLQSPQNRWVAVLEGHGERRLDGQALHDLGRWGQMLASRGFRMRPLDLTRERRVPDNTDLAILSTPNVSLFPGETEALIDFVARGGNLLWLMDPDRQGGLGPLLAHLGVSVLPGTVVDAAGAALGIDSPTVAVVQPDSGHELLAGLTQPIQMPGSSAFAPRVGNGWSVTMPLNSSPLSWNETGPLTGEIERDEDLSERTGPLPLALAITRQFGPPEGEDSREQRLFLVGDGDFLSNGHIEKGANSELGLRIARWLTGQEDLLSIPDDPGDRGPLTIAPKQLLWIIGIPMAVIPALLAGFAVWIRRRRAHMPERPTGKSTDEAAEPRPAAEETPA